MSCAYFRLKSVEQTEEERDVSPECSNSDRAAYYMRQLTALEQWIYHTAG